MSYQHPMFVGLSMSILTVLLLCSQAAGFNPQPEPPGALPDTWRVEGYIDLYAQTTSQTGLDMPFGIDPGIVGDAALDFSAGVIARFTAPTTADSKPHDGLYDVEFEYLLLRIGDTTWDQTLLGTIQFQVLDGLVNGCSGIYTDTMPSHPDLSFELPASPGTWQALDERDDVNLGTVAGTYELRDGVVPEPVTLSLMALGGLALLRRRPA